MRTLQNVFLGRHVLARSRNNDGSLDDDPCEELIHARRDGITGSRAEALVVGWRISCETLYYNVYIIYICYIPRGGDRLTLADAFEL